MSISFPTFLVSSKRRFGVVIFLMATASFAVFRMEFGLSQTVPFDPLKDNQSLCVTDSLDVRSQIAQTPGAHFEVDIPVWEDGKRGMKSGTFVALQGEMVTIRVRSAENGAVEVHGLSTSYDVLAGGSVDVRFTSDKTGSFPLHFHTPAGDHIPIAMLVLAARR